MLQFLDPRQGSKLLLVLHEIFIWNRITQSIWLPKVTFWSGKFWQSLPTWFTVNACKPQIFTLFFLVSCVTSMNHYRLLLLLFSFSLFWFFFHSKRRKTPILTATTPVTLQEACFQSLGAYQSYDPWTHPPKKKTVAARSWILTSSSICSFIWKTAHFIYYLTADISINWAYMASFYKRNQKGKIPGEEVSSSNDGLGGGGVLFFFPQGTEKTLFIRFQLVLFAITCDRIEASKWIFP